MKRSAISTAKEHHLRRLANLELGVREVNNHDIFKKYQSPNFGNSFVKEENCNKTFKDFYKTFGCGEFI